MGTVLTEWMLCWQIQDISVETEDNKEKKSAKDALLLWCQMKTAGWEKSGKGETEGGINHTG